MWCLVELLTTISENGLSTAAQTLKGSSKGKLDQKAANDVNYLALAHESGLQAFGPVHPTRIAAATLQTGHPESLVPAFCNSCCEHVRILNLQVQRQLDMRRAAPMSVSTFCIHTRFRGMGSPKTGKQTPGFYCIALLHQRSECLCNTNTRPASKQ